MRILIADDDPVFLALLEDLVTGWSHEPTLARDGEEAWRIFTGPEPPKLVLLDWIMPGINGFDLCRRIRQEEPEQDGTYIILITGSSAEKDIMKVVVAGADDYLLKPFEPSALAVSLRTGVRMLDLRAEIARLKRPRSAEFGLVLDT